MAGAPIRVWAWGGGVRSVQKASLICEVPVVRIAGLVLFLRELRSKGVSNVPSQSSLDASSELAS